MLNLDFLAVGDINSVDGFKHRHCVLDLWQSARESLERAVIFKHSCIQYPKRTKTAVKGFWLHWKSKVFIVVLSSNSWDMIWLKLEDNFTYFKTLCLSRQTFVTFLCSVRIKNSFIVFKPLTKCDWVESSGFTAGGTGESESSSRRELAELNCKVWVNSARSGLSKVYLNRLEGEKSAVSFPALCGSIFTCCIKKSIM